jgi:protein phosphatase
MALEIGALTDIGRVRAGNEDAYEVVPLDEATLCIVADGMGGHEAGEVASQIAVETIRDAAPALSGDPAERLRAAIERANTAIVEAGRANPAQRGMGTTILCALLSPAGAVLANVGDSPAYLVRDGRAVQLTHDHSLVGEAVTRGELTEEQAAVHPYRNVLSRCLGLDPEVEVETYAPIAMRAGDVLILCSDGLPEHVRLRDLPEMVEGRSAQQAAEALVRLANERGGVDNITVVTARWQPD